LPRSPFEKSVSGISAFAAAFLIEVFFFILSDF
jgi:hypothetical protein